MKSSLLALFAAAAFLLSAAPACDSPADSGGPGTAVDGPGSGDCTPKCAFKECGNDSCGGSCGSCVRGMLCDDGLFQCIVDPNGAGPDVDPDGNPPIILDPSVDSDLDTVNDVVDNCPSVHNTTQSNIDGDDLGDACDPDMDGDGWLNEQDCAQHDPNVNPSEMEWCNNGVDDNCNGEENEIDAADCRDYFVDGDGDGAGASSTLSCQCAPTSGVAHVTLGGDCDDGNPSLGPLTVEACDNIDNNCNSLVDEGCDDDADGFCDSAMQLIGSPTACPMGGNDCYDYSAAVNPGVAEIEADGLDNDCDGEAQGEPENGPIPQPTCGQPLIGQTTDAMVNALELCYGASVVQNVSIYSPTGDDTAQAWNVVNRFGSSSNDLAPFGGNSYVIMASGPASGTSHTTDLAGGSSTSDPYSSDGYPTYDNVEIRLQLKAPLTAKGFSIDYVFFSEEYEEFIGTDFNDKFYIFMKAPITTGNQKVVINTTQCSSPNTYWDLVDDDGVKWCYIAINTAFSEPCGYPPGPATNISGTGFECATSIDTSATGSSTGWLSTKWPVKGGEEFELIFHIHDTSDGIYDSEVILDNFKWEGGAFNAGTASHD